MTVFMRSPQGEIKEVEATAAALSPLMIACWHQIPAPAPIPPDPHQVEMQSPTGEVKEVEATAEALSPLMAAGWHELPAEKETK